VKKIILAILLTIMMAGCVSRNNDSESVLTAVESTKQSEQRTKRAEQTTLQYELYYTNLVPEAASLAVIAAPEGAVFAPTPAPAPTPRRKRRVDKDSLIEPSTPDALIMPSTPDPVCTYAPANFDYCPE